LALLAAAAVAGAALLYLGPSRAVLDALEAEVRPRGGVLHRGEARTRVLHDDVRGARIELGDGTALEAPEARVSRRWFGPPEIRVPRGRVTLHRDPLSAFSGFRDLEAALPAELSTERVAVDYRHRAVGHLTMDGIRRAPGKNAGAFVTEQLQFGRMRWSDVVFSVAARKRALEVTFGEGKGPGATARYLASDGRAGEWLLQVPRQPFGALLGSLGLKPPSGADATRVTGTLSWIVPEDPAVVARGSFRLILDGWPLPAWPDASALVGNNGSLAATLAPGADPTTVRVENLKVETAHFPLDGSGTVTLTEPPVVELTAKGRRACAELAQSLPDSRYRTVIAAHAAKAGESVELSLGARLARDGARFEWHASAGCGLEAR